MPTQNSKVNFKYGTQAQYDSLQTKDNSTLHITTDSQRTYLGDEEIGRGRWIVTVTMGNNFEFTANRTSTQIIAALATGCEVLAELILDSSHTYFLPYSGTNGTYLFFTGQLAHPLFGNSSSAYAYASLVCEIDDDDWNIPTTITATNLMYLDEVYLSSINYAKISLSYSNNAWTGTVDVNNSISLPDDMTRMVSRLPWIIYIDTTFIGIGTFTYVGPGSETDTYLYDVLLSSPYTSNNTAIIGVRVLTSATGLDPTLPYPQGLEFVQILTAPTYAGSASAGGAANLSAAIPYGECDSTSTATVFTATVPGITELRDGVCMLLYNGVITSASGFTINVNGLGAKPSYSNMALGNPVTPTSPTRDTTIFNVNYAFLFIYSETLVSGGCWVGYRGYDANTNTIGYQLRTNSSTMKAESKFYRYRLLFTSADGTKWVPANTSTSTNATAKRDTNQSPIDPFGEIVWYGTTTAIEANATVTAAQIWQEYAGTYSVIGYSFNRTGAAQTMTANLPIYIKCAPQSDGSAIIDAESPYVQTLPSTEDGKIYIFLGRAYSATNFELLMNHPVYYYKDGAIRIWTNASASSMPSTAVGSSINPIYWSGSAFTPTTETLPPTLTCSITDQQVLQAFYLAIIWGEPAPSQLIWNFSSAFVSGFDSDYNDKLDTMKSLGKGIVKFAVPNGNIFFNYNVSYALLVDDETDPALYFDYFSGECYVDKGAFGGPSSSWPVYLQIGIMRNQDDYSDIRVGFAVSKPYDLGNMELSIGSYRTPIYWTGSQFSECTLPSGSAFTIAEGTATAATVTKPST